MHACSLCETKFTMREIYSISCMKEGNVQIILRCKMVLLYTLSWTVLRRTANWEKFHTWIKSEIMIQTAINSHTHLNVIMLSPSKITKNFKYMWNNWDHFLRSISINNLTATACPDLLSIYILTCFPRNVVTVIITIMALTSRLPQFEKRNLLLSSARSIILYMYAGGDPMKSLSFQWVWRN